MFTDVFGLKGRVVVTMKDVRDGREWTAWDDHNLIVGSLRTGWVGWLTGSSWNPPSWIGIGTGTASATSQSASGLQFETVRQSATVRENLSLYTAKYVTTYGTTVGNGTIREAGLFNASGVASMFAIAQLNVVKNSSNAMSVTWFLAVMSGSAL